MQAELTEHVDYEKGDPEAWLYPNSRNGSFPKTVGTSIGDVELRIPRDRNGTFTPKALEQLAIAFPAGIEHYL